MSQNADTAETTAEAPPKKKILVPIIVGIVGALCLGGGAFYAVYSGLVLSNDPKPAEQASTLDRRPLPIYMPIEQLTLSLATPSGAQHLRLSAHIEIANNRLAEAEAYRPRFLSVMNTYLRAVEPRDLQDPAALIRLRAQILRRLQMVAGEDLVEDFLITEFILN